MWHYYSMFPQNILEKRKHDSEEVASGDKIRVKAYEWWKEYGEKVKPPEWYGKKVVENQPALMIGLTGAYKYTVREELFDKEFIKNIMKMV